jgi:hypothetical protein
MDAKPLLWPLFALALACSGQAAPARSARATLPERVTPEPAAEPSLAQTLAEADAQYAAQLGAQRGGRFDTERQIGVLKQAVLLYTQFLERAEGRPELADAVKKSLERRADANDTIVFLEGSLREQLRDRDGR